MANESPQKTVVDTIVDNLRTGIMQGRYLPGQHLTENELQQEMGVSRGPLREAMRRLAGDGLLSIEPHRGCTVRRLSAEELTAVYEIRTLLEGFAARNAARRMGEENAAGKLEELIEKMQPHKTREDTEAYMELNREFHDLIMDLSGNTLLKDVVGQLRVPTFRLLYSGLLSPAFRKQSIKQHEAIAEAILSGDSRKAQRAMEKHVRHSGEVLQGLR